MHRFLFPLYCALLAVVCRFAVCIQTQLISFFVDEIIIFRLAVKQFLFLNFHHSYDCRNLIPPVNFSRVNKTPPIHSTQHDQLSTQELSSSLPTQKNTPKLRLSNSLPTHSKLILFSLFPMSSKFPHSWYFWSI